MTPSTLTWVVTLGLITAIAVLEPDFGEYLALTAIRLRQWFELKKFWALNNPRFPWVRLRIEVRSRLLARKLLKELKRNGHSRGNDSTGIKDNLPER